MKGAKPQKMGLTDPELIEKYEKGALPIHKHIKKLLRKPSNAAILKKKNKA